MSENTANEHMKGECRNNGSMKDVSAAGGKMDNENTTYGNMNRLNYYMEKAYDRNSNVVFFPVRHHSPACAFHLKKVINEFNPEIILIEGPADANKVMQYLNHEDTKTPVCIYYSYSDSKGLVDESKEKYMCYYPFLDFSPEMAALRQAAAKGIPAEFMDLSYAQILINCSSENTMRKPQDKNTYNDDYLMQRSAFIEALCEKEGCRSYNELWEKLFEIDGLAISTEKFIKNMIVSCYLSRTDYTAEMLSEEGCTARESFMSMKIRAAVKAHKKVLVVSGGFHTSALIDGLDTNEEIKLYDIPEKDTGVYVMAYSFRESDQLSGYASGMPHPAFYQKVWDNIQANRKRPYEEAVLNFIVRCGGKIKKKEGGLSTADEIEAFNMARGLKALRGKKECGVYELYDGIRSSFVKGEVSISTDAPLKYLGELLTGERIGELCSLAEIPPIVKDFREHCRQYKFAASTVEVETQLFIYKNKRYRERSAFFHRMKFLKTGFCTLEKGPDFAKRKNTNLVRELWKYKWDSKVESSLIELSVYGGSVKEASVSVLTGEFMDIKNGSGEASMLLIEAFMMGLGDCFDRLLPAIREILIEDSDFTSVADCCYNLNFLYNAQQLLDADNSGSIKEFLIQGYSKAVQLIPGLYSTAYEAENDIISRLKDVYLISGKDYLGVDCGLLVEALKGLCGRKNCNSAVEGAAWGMLYGLNVTDSKTLCSKAEEYLYATGEILLKSGSFLKGLFSTAKDVLLFEEGLLKGLDNVMRKMEEEQFLSLVPDLRLCFTYFTPGEIDSISRIVGGFYEIEKEELLHSEAVNEEDIKLAEMLDAFGTEYLEKWHLQKAGRST